MARIFLAVFMLLATAAFASAANVKVFVLAIPERPADAFLGGVPSQALTDSARDIRNKILDARNGLTCTKKRPNAAIVVEVVSREERDGEYRVHVEDSPHKGGPPHRVYRRSLISTRARLLRQRGLARSHGWVIAA